MASEYEQIGREMEAAFARQRAYEEEGEKFAAKLCGAVQTALDVPPEQFRLLPPDEEEEGKTYFLAGALKLGEDAFFRVRLRLHYGEVLAQRLAFGPSGYFTMLAQFRRNPDAPTWEVSLRKDGKMATVDPVDFAAVQRVARDFAEGMKVELRTMFDRFLKGEEPRKRMGFAVD